MKKKIILTSAITILVCLCVITGATFALFTSTDDVNMTVTAGTVKVTAKMKVQNVRTEFVTYKDYDTKYVDNIATSVAGSSVYDFETFDETGGAGRAILSSDCRTLTLENIKPGDEVNLTVDLTNTSNIAIKYIVVCEVTSKVAQTNPLSRVLEVYVNNSKSKIDATGTQYVPSNWSKVAPNAALTDIPVRVYLPDDIGGPTVDDNLYQGASAELKFTVYAIQANAADELAYSQFGIAAPVVNP